MCLMYSNLWFDIGCKKRQVHKIVNKIYASYMYFITSIILKTSVRILDFNPRFSFNFYAEISRGLYVTN